MLKEYRRIKYSLKARRKVCSIRLAGMSVGPDRIMLVDLVNSSKKRIYGEVVLRTQRLDTDAVAVVRDMAEVVGVAIRNEQCIYVTVDDNADMCSREYE